MSIRQPAHLSLMALCMAILACSSLVPPATVPTENNQNLILGPVVAAVALRLDGNQKQLSGFLGPNSEVWDLEAGHYLVSAVDQNGLTIVFSDMHIVDVPLIWPPDFNSAGPQKNQQRAQAITTLVKFLITVEEAKLTALENSSAGFSAPPAAVTQPAATEAPTEELLPRISATGQFAESISGDIRADPPNGATFELVADFAAGTVSGTLTTGRTIKGAIEKCTDANGVVYDMAKVDYTSSYQTTFSGGLDPESGEFSVPISLTGGCSGRLVSPFTEEACRPLNDQLGGSCGALLGEGTISGYVSKYGWVEFTTQWTCCDGRGQVSGSWSGEGSLETP